MTEAEWLTATDPAPILEYVRGKASDRKLRLVACACARDVEEHTLREGDIAVSELVERYADGQAEVTEIQAAAVEAERAAYLQTYRIGDAFGVIRAALMLDAVGSAVDAVMWLKSFYSYDGPETPDRLRPSAFCRDIFGNPFRPAVVAPDWLTSTVRSLAEGIYQERAFDRLPILADALMDAGCDNEGVLNHCRSEGPHVRGCWVVDLLLGKK